VARLSAQVKEIFPIGRAMVANEVVGTSQGFRIARAMSWSTSILAIIVGVLGVMNTMMMTVFERSQEICVLLAIGWKRSRIMRMILWESAMLGLLGGFVGILLGSVGVKLLATTPAMRGLLEPNLAPGLLATAVGIAVVVGVVSGLYPAWRSSRLTPSHALHG
jgi:putative ABC transport system permease protein